MDSGTLKSEIRTSIDSSPRSVYKIMAENPDLSPDWVAMQKIDETSLAKLYLLGSAAYLTESLNDVFCSEIDAVNFTYRHILEISEFIFEGKAKIDNIWKEALADLLTKTPNK